MNLELIDKSLNDKVEELVKHAFYPEKLGEMCGGASRDRINGISAKGAHTDHPLWGEGTDFTKWPVDKQLKYLLVHGFTPECIFSQSGAVMKKYRVVVRAIVVATPKVLDDHDFGADWEVYDCDNQDECTTIRLDTVIDVSAYNKQNAIDVAKCDAPTLGLKTEDVEVTLWVDDAQKSDVELI